APPRYLWPHCRNGNHGSVVVAVSLSRRLPVLSAIWGELVHRRDDTDDDGADKETKDHRGDGVDYPGKKTCGYRRGQAVDNVSRLSDIEIRQTGDNNMATDPPPASRAQHTNDVESMRHAVDYCCAHRRFAVAASEHR